MSRNKIISVKVVPGSAEKIASIIIAGGSDEQIAAYVCRSPDSDGEPTVLPDGTIGSRPGGPAEVGLARWEELTCAMPEV